MTPCDICKSVVPLEADPCASGSPRPDRVLVVEDDQLAGQDLKERLEFLGYQVVGVAASAEQAVSLARTQAPDLALMDIQLAGEMDGIQAAHSIVALRVPVVYVTGSCSDLILRRAVETEPCGYLLKPYETRDLKIAVQVALRKHRAEQDRQRLLKRFQNVLGNVKTLGGMLSICAYCKKIKNSAGEWPEVEAYVMAHSHATFSHGMCPGCFARVKAQLQAVEAESAGSDSLVLG